MFQRPQLTHCRHSIHAVNFGQCHEIGNFDFSKKNVQLIGFSRLKSVENISANGRPEESKRTVTSNENEQS